MRYSVWLSIRQNDPVRSCYPNLPRFQVKAVSHPKQEVVAPVPQALEDSLFGTVFGNQSDETRRKPPDRFQPTALQCLEAGKLTGILPTVFSDRVQVWPGVRSLILGHKSPSGGGVRA